MGYRHNPRMIENPPRKKAPHLFGTAPFSRRLLRFRERVGLAYAHAVQRERLESADRLCGVHQDLVFRSCIDAGVGLARRRFPVRLLEDEDELCADLCFLYCHSNPSFCGSPPRGNLGLGDIRGLCRHDDCALESGRGGACARHESGRDLLRGCLDGGHGEAVCGICDGEIHRAAAVCVEGKFEFLGHVIYPPCLSCGDFGSSFL